MEINSHKPKIADTIYPTTPIMDIPWILGPVFEFIIMEEPTIIPAIIREKDNLLIILLNSSIYLLLSIFKFTFALPLVRVLVSSTSFSGIFETL